MIAPDGSARRSTRPAFALAAVAVLIAFATAWLGWPAPAVVGATIGALVSSGALRLTPTSSRRLAAGAAALGWAGLIARDTMGGRMERVVAMLGSLVGVRGGAAVAVGVLLAMLTIALGAVLAWAGATLVAGILDAVRASAPGRVTLSGTADVAPARRAERAPAAQTP